MSTTVATTGTGNQQDILPRPRKSTNVQPMASTSSAASAKETGQTIIRQEYDLDEINAMEKKLDACERNPGLHIDLSRGETSSNTQIYLKSCPGSYEYFRIHMRDILKYIFNTDDYPKVVEEEDKYVKV